MSLLSFLPAPSAWRQARRLHALPLPDFRLESTLLAHYSLREKELARLMQEAREIEPSRLLHAVVSLLERRIENVVYRMGFAKNIPQARILIRRGHILLNRYLPKHAGTILRPGDVVHYTLKPYDAGSMTQFPKRPLPSYLQYLNSYTTDRGMMTVLPSLDDSPLQLFRPHLSIAVASMRWLIEPLSGSISVSRRN